MFSHGQQAGDYSHSDADARQASRQEKAHQLLSSELVEALLTDPQRTVPTPGWPHAGKWRALDVFQDHMETDRFALSLLDLLRECDKSADPAIRIRAQAIYAEAGRIHADWHSEAVE